jgi:HKD family nuclease
LVKIGFAPPIANAGADKTVDEGTLVTLDGSASYDPDGDPITYQWEQIQGPSVTLSDPNSPTPSFTAPFVDVITTLKFRLTVSDGSLSSSAVVYVYVRNISAYDYYPWFTLKGTDSYSIPDDPSLRLTQFSVSAWFRTSSVFTADAIIVNKGGFNTSTSRLNYGVWLTSNGNLRGGFEESTGTDIFVTSPNRYNDGNWHYAVVTYDGSVLRLYVDGQQVASLNTNAMPATDTMPLTIGKNSSSNSNYFIGDIDEVRVYNRALSAQEVSDAYNNGIFSNDGLVIYLHMNHILLPSGITNLRDLYFNDLLNEVNNAKRKIWASNYWLEYNPNQPSNRATILLNAVKAAKDRGVDVRIIFHPDTLKNSTFNPNGALKNFLDSNDIPYITVGNHAKVVVIDDKIAYVGTGNWNNNGLRNNHEMFVKSYNPNIINRANKFLTNLWIYGGGTAFNDDNYDNVFITNGYLDSMLNSIRNARNSINIIMFVIAGGSNTERVGDLLRALVDAKNRGVDVRILVDYDWDGNNNGIPDNKDAVAYLKSNGIQVKSDEGEPPRTHIKMIIIDDETVYVGSQNWDYTGLGSSVESSVKIKSPWIVNDSVEYFNWKWARGRAL